jgi:hypothetical protein
MKRFFRIFELSRNEQRVVLIVIFVLIAIVFVGYERRVHCIHVRTPNAPESKTSPSPVGIEHAQ